MRLIVEQSEFIPCDLQDAVRVLKGNEPLVARRFIENFCITVEQLAEMPELGRRRLDLGFDEIRSWRVKGFRKYLLFYDVMPDRLRLWRLLHGSRDLQAELGR